MLCFRNPRFPVALNELLDLLAYSAVLLATFDEREACNTNTPTVRCCGVSHDARLLSARELRVCLAVMSVLNLRALLWRFSSNPASLLTPKEQTRPPFALLPFTRKYVKLLRVQSVMLSVGLLELFCPNSKLTQRYLLKEVYTVAMCSVYSPGVFCETGFLCSNCAQNAVVKLIDVRRVAFVILLLQGLFCSNTNQ